MQLNNRIKAAKIGYIVERPIIIPNSSLAVIIETDTALLFLTFF